MSVFAVPGWVRVVSRGSRGSFAADGRDAGLKTGVPLPAARSAGRSLDGAPPQSNLTDPTYPTPWLHRENWRRFFVTGLLWSGAMPTAEKANGSELCSLPAISGESVKGGTPLSQSMMTNRNLPPRADGAQGSFDSRARSGWESGPPTPTPPAPGSPCGSRRTSEARATDGWESGSPTPTPPAPGSPCGSRRTSEVRREAPGGLWTGPRRNRA